MYEKAKTQLSAKIETEFPLSGEAVDAISKLWAGQATKKCVGGSN